MAVPWPKNVDHLCDNRGIRRAAEGWNPSTALTINRPWSEGRYPAMSIMLARPTDRHHPSGQTISVRPLTLLAV
jgi:hypothetical protein